MFSPLQRDSSERFQLTLGISCSVVIHILLVLLIVFGIHAGPDNNPEPIVYSISIEGGKTLGGLAQVPEKNQGQTAPPKAVAQPENQDQVAPPDAEVSIPEKKKIEPTPLPKATPAPKKVTPTPAPKKTPEKTKPKEPSAADINKDYQKAMQRYLGESSEAGGKGFGAAKIGGKGMGGGVQKPPEFFIYRQKLRDHIKQGWKWYNTAAPLVCTVTFTIARDGTVGSIALAQGSGNPEFDDSVLRALYKASPVPPPPPTVYDDFKAVRMQFDPRE